MPHRALPLALLLLLLACPAAAQSGTGTITGLVLPEHPTYAGASGAWDVEGAGDDAYAAGPVLTLTPIRTHVPTEKRAVRARGGDGRYDFGVIPMGLYHLRVDAPGYTSWEAEVYVPSDTVTKVHILLRREE